MEFNKPEKLSLEGDVAENFRLFKEDVDNYIIATESNRKPNAVQVARFKNLMGKDALQLYNSIKNDEEHETVESIFTVLQEYCLPKKNEIMNVFNFITCKQQENEPFDKFLAKLRNLIKKCEFGNQEDKLIRAQIALGISSHEVKERLLRDDASLDKMIQYCKSVEVASMNMKLLKKEVSSSNNNVFAVDRSQLQQNYKVTSGANYTKKGCNRCGGFHQTMNFCPAMGKQCTWCKRMNHFSKVCMQRLWSQQDQKQLQQQKCKPRHEIQGLENVAESEDTSEIIDSVHLVSTINKKVWFKTTMVEGFQINFKLDTGAEVNIIPYDIVKRLGLLSNLRKTNVKLEAYGGFKIFPLGELRAQVETGQKFDIVDFIVVKGSVTPILGLETCISLGLIQRLDNISKLQSKISGISENNDKQNLYKEYKDVFSGLGCFPDKCSIKLTDQAVPYASSARRIPLKIQEKFKEKLEDLVKKGIIEQVNEPVEWISNIVIVEKRDESLRICIDPQQLNKYIVRERAVIPTIDDISLRLANKRFYSVLDIKDGFYHFQLDDKSMKLCNFSTIFGTYRFLRSPFGLSNLPELFHKCVSKYFEDIPGVTVYFDDICIAANSKEENYAIVKKVLDRARSLNIKFNFEKFQYCLPEIKYLGLIFSESGIRSDNGKVAVINGLPNPTSKNELQRLLGMVNFLRAFIPNIAQLTSPLRELLKKDVPWIWTEVHTKALNDVKRILTSNQVIAPFNSSVPIVIQCDASKDSLGCCLLQGNRPVCMASRSLNAAETEYAQIEKELLAIVYACSKFHTYIYGHDNITVHTDHMPLVSLINKPVNKIQNNRLRRLKLKLLPYRFKLQYLPGKFMYIADFLSRCGIKTKENVDEAMMDMVHCVSESGTVQFSDERLEEFKLETINDKVLGKIIQYYNHGWPTNMNSGDELAHYFKIRNDIELSDGLLYYNSRIIIPNKLRNLILKRLHETHLGETKMNGIVSSFYYWPGIRSDVKNIVENCNICQKYRRSNIREPLNCHEVPNVPFLKVGTDIAEWAGKMYLVLIDYYSRWLEVVQINSKTSTAVKNALIKIFSRLGIPQVLISDNVPFNSYEMIEFAKKWNFRIQTTSPNYPQSNGLAEKGVGIAKKMIKIASETGEDLNLSLLNYRNSVVAGLNYSPAQLLMGRVLRSKMPVPNNRLIADQIPNEKLKNDMVRNKIKQKINYDKNCRQGENFKVGDTIYVQNSRTKYWELGIIVNQLGAPRSYLIKNENGQIFRRNSRFIRRRKSCSLQEGDV